MSHHKFYQGDVLEVLKTLPDNLVQCVVTSPPYFNLRDYGINGQVGLEKSPEEYVNKLVDVFREVRRVLRDDGVLWLNLGDSYASDPKKGYGGIDPKNPGKGSQRARGISDNLKPKDLVGIPWMVAFALRADGWYLRSDIIWEKPNPMPESVTDRPTKSHEYIFLLSKSERYYYDADAIKEPSGPPKKCGSGSRADNDRDPSHGTRKQDAIAKRTYVGFNERYEHKNTRNKRTVWTVATKPFKGAHFAVFPPDLIKPCILAGSKPGDIILDPFGGAGTTTLQAMTHDRDSIYIDLNSKYLNLALDRLGFGENQPRLLEYHTHEIIRLDEIKDIKRAKSALVGGDNENLKI